MARSYPVYTVDPSTCLSNPEACMTGGGSIGSVGGQIVRQVPGGPGGSQFQPGFSISGWGDPGVGTTGPWAGGGMQYGGVFSMDGGGITPTPLWGSGLGALTGAGGSGPFWGNWAGLPSGPGFVSPSTFGFPGPGADFNQFPFFGGGANFPSLAFSMGCPDGTPMDAFGRCGAAIFPGFGPQFAAPGGGWGGPPWGGGGGPWGGGPPVSPYQSQFNLSPFGPTELPVDPLYGKHALWNPWMPPLAMPLTPGGFGGLPAGVSTRQNPTILFNPPTLSGPAIPQGQSQGMPYIGFATSDLSADELDGAMSMDFDEMDMDPGFHGGLPWGGHHEFHGGPEFFHGGLPDFDPLLIGGGPPGIGFPPEPFPPIEPFGIGEEFPWWLYGEEGWPWWGGRWGHHGWGPWGWGHGWGPWGWGHGGWGRGWGHEGWGRGGWGHGGEHFGGHFGGGGGHFGGGGHGGGGGHMRAHQARELHHMMHGGHGGFNHRGGRTHGGWGHGGWGRRGHEGRGGWGRGREHGGRGRWGHEGRFGRGRGDDDDFGGGDFDFDDFGGGFPFGGGDDDDDDDRRRGRHHRGRWGHEGHRGHEGHEGHRGFYAAYQGYAGHGGGSAGSHTPHEVTPSATTHQTHGHAGGGVSRTPVSGHGGEMRGHMIGGIMHEGGMRMIGGIAHHGGRGDSIHPGGHIDRFGRGGRFDDGRFGRYGDRDFDRGRYYGRDWDDYYRGYYPDFDDDYPGFDIPQLCEFDHRFRREHPELCAPYLPL